MYPYPASSTSAPRYMLFPQTECVAEEKSPSQTRTPHRHILSGHKLCIAHNGSNSRSARRAHTGKLPAAEPSSRCRTSYIPAAMQNRTVPRPTTFPVSKLAICASPTEYTTSVGYRSSAPDGYTKGSSSRLTIAPGIWLSIDCLCVVFKIRQLQRTVEA